jgi:hypothetical protein
MARTGAWVAVCCALACAGGGWCSGEPRLPVLSVAYDGTAGSTESEQELAEETGDAAWESASFRHQGTLRIREEWSRALVSTLVSDLIRKQYASGSGRSYTAVEVSPQLRWTIAEGLKWDTTLLVKRALYDEPYAQSSGYTRLKADTGLSVGLAEGITLEPRLRAILEPHEDAMDSLQRYGFGVSLEARIGRWSFGADYRGTLRLELGDLSTVTRRMDHAFGAKVSWDPNRKDGTKDEGQED